MVLKWKLGQLVWQDLLPLKQFSFSSTPLSFDSTVITLSRDIVHKFEKTRLCRKKVDSLYFSRKQTSFDKLATSAFCYFRFRVCLWVIWLVEIPLRHFSGSISWKQENAALRFGQSDYPYFIPANVSFSILWTISLDRVITVLSNDSGVEEKLNCLRGRRSCQTSWPSFHFKTMSLFILKETNTIFIKLIFSMFSCILSFVDMPMVLSTY